MASLLLLFPTPPPPLSNTAVLECIAYFCLSEEEIRATNIRQPPPSRFSLDRNILLKDALDWVGKDAFKRSVEFVANMTVMSMGVDMAPGTEGRGGCPTSATLRMVGRQGHMNVVILVHRRTREVSVIMAGTGE